MAKTSRFGDDKQLLVQLTQFIRHVDSVETEFEINNKPYWSTDQLHSTYINHENILHWMFETFADRTGCSCFDLLNREAQGSGMDALTDIPYHVVTLCVRKRLDVLSWLVYRVTAHTPTAGTPSNSEAKETTQN